MATRVISRVREEFHTVLPMPAFFRCPTIAGLAATLTEQLPEKGGSPVDSLIAIQSCGSNPPLFLVHGAGGGMLWGYANLSRELGKDQPVYAFRPRGLNDISQFDTIEKMATHYIEKIRAVQAHGPYYLGGYCFGGNVAYEMARQMELHGEEVALLVLMNSVPPNSRYVRAAPSAALIIKFLLNLIWLIFRQFRRTPGQRRQFFTWQMNALGRRLSRLLSRSRAQAAIRADEVVDLSSYPAEERLIWEAHVQALFQHQTGQCASRVALLRSRGHQFWCSFDPAYGWREFARGEVNVHIVSGAHEEILEVTHVRSLAAELSLELEQARQSPRPVAAPGRSGQSFPAATVNVGRTAAIACELENHA